MSSKAKQKVDEYQRLAQELEPYYDAGLEVLRRLVNPAQRYDSDRVSGRGRGVRQAGQPTPTRDGGVLRRETGRRSRGKWRDPFFGGVRPGS